MEAPEDLTGRTVQHTEKYKSTLHPSSPYQTRTGRVIRYTSDERCAIVIWEETKAPQQIHRSFIEPACPAPEPEPELDLQAEAERRYPFKGPENEHNSCRAKERQAQPTTADARGDQKKIEC